MKAANLDSRTVALRNKKFYRSIQHGQGVQNAALVHRLASVPDD